MTSRFIAVLGIGQILSWGTLYYSFPQLADPIARALGLGRDEVYAAASLALGFGALGAYPVGRLVDLGQGRWVMSLGCALGGAALLALALLEAPGWLYVIFAAIGLAQAMCLYEPAFAVIARRDIDQARDGILKLTLWAGFASSVFIPLIQVLLDALNWRATVTILGLLLLVVGTGLHWRLLAHTPARVQPPPSNSPIAAAPAPLRALVKRPVFWALLLTFTAYAATFSTLSLHLYPLLLERGADVAVVVLALAVIGPAQVLGRVLLWRWGSGMSVRHIGMATAIALPLSILFLAVAPPSAGWLVFLAGLYGMANGVMTIVRGLAVPEMLSRHAYGAVNGVLAAPAMLVRAAAPVTAAMLWASEQRYAPVLVAVVLAGLVLALSFAAAVWFTRGNTRPV